MPWCSVVFVIDIVQSTASEGTKNQKNDELGNHLGNVLTIISDKKLGVSSGGSLIDYYNPEIKSAQDYYPFGMTMPGRFPIGGAPYYKYTFNGQENDWEINGWQNLMGAQYWEYDTRLGRRWNLDPVIKDGESPYASFHNNPIMYNDPFGDDPPKKPGRWTRFWRALSHDYYQTRAENYANKHNIDEENIVKFDNTWVIIDDKNSKDVRYSIFRQSKRLSGTLWSDSDKNDDVNLSQSDLLKTEVMGETIIDAPIPGAGVSKIGGVVAMGGRSRLAILGVVKQTGKALEAFQKYIRFGVTGHPDVLKKGFHLHFDEVVKNLELGLRPLDKGGIGFVQVGKLSIGTANDIKKAVELFNQAMQSSKFRSELIVRLKTAQEYLQKTFKYTSNSQLAIDKAHEINYLIKAVQNF